MYLIRDLEPSDLAAVKDFVPPDWNTDLSSVFSIHLGQSNFFPIVAELDGKLIGCAEGINNTNAGWLGNIIVHPSNRGQGVGLDLTRHLMDYFHAKRCASQILIATKMGEPVYRRLGYRIVSNYIFLRRETILHSESSLFIRSAKESDYPAILNLDQATTGENRAPFLKRFLATAHIFARAEDLEGFYLPELAQGPIIAKDDLAGLQLLKFRLAMGSLTTVIPDANLRALEFLRINGFVEISRSLRMVLQQDVAWKPEWIFSRGSGYCG